MAEAIMTALPPHGAQAIDGVTIGWRTLTG
jgi:hypothetical protein